MNFKNLFDFKKIFNSLCNLKYYISFNLFSLLGWIDVIFFSLLFELDKGDTTGIGFVFWGTIYLAISRTVVLFILLLFLIEKIKKFKIKQNLFMDNIFFNVIFYFGLLSFTALNLLVLFLLLYSFFLVTFYKLQVL